MNKLVTFILLFYFLPLYGQNTRNEKIKVEQEIENENYTGAIKSCRLLLKNNPNENNIQTMLGYCYLKLGNYDSAFYFLEKSVVFYKTKKELKKHEAQNALYYLASSYFMIYNFEDAQKTYKILQDINDNFRKEEVENAISQCDSAQKLFENPKGFFVFRPGIINSNYPDYGPVLSVSQGKMYFTSRRPGSTGGQKDIDGYDFEDIYTVDITDGEFSKPKRLDAPINTSGYEATSSISYDGKTMFIYKSSNYDDGDIYISQYSGGHWSEPLRMPEPVNSKYRETHASMSPDGKFLYFTSDRKGGHGGLDIYSAELSNDGMWTNVKNLGGEINTLKDEKGPIVSPDGYTLYFSSNGHFGMGGFDIYKSKKKINNEWSNPVNMGFPLNTVNDDLFFVPTNNPEEAYYSSEQVDGTSSILFVQIYDNEGNNFVVKGDIYNSIVQNLNKNLLKSDSIYFVNQLFPLNKKIKFTNNKTHFFKVAKDFVLDSIFGVPKNSSIKVYNVDDKSLVGNYVASNTGKYSFPLSSNQNYISYYSAPGYSYDFYEIKDKSKTNIYNVELDSLIDGQIRIVKYSFFEKNSYKLSSLQLMELDFLIEFLKSKNNLCVDISSFVNQSKSDINKGDVIIDYLLEHEIDSSRIFQNLFQDFIADSVVVYTIYDTLSVKKIIEENKKELKIVRNKIIHGALVNDVRFELNMSESPEFYNDLDFLAKFLIKNADAKIGVYGYTDIQGNPSYNQRLSNDRANFIKDYLIKKGVDENQVIAEGHGFSKQIAKNKNNRGQYMWNSLKYNRRVEIEILRQGKKEKLFVKPIDVPNQFQINVSRNTFYYSINVLSSEKKLPEENFIFEVTELQGSDGLYNYIYGEFDHEIEAETFINSIRNEYPKAFVFINNYRK